MSKDSGGGHKNAPYRILKRNFCGIPGFAPHSRGFLQKAHQVKKTVASADATNTVIRSFLVISVSMCQLRRFWAACLRQRWVQKRLSVRCEVKASPHFSHLRTSTAENASASVFIVYVAWLNSSHALALLTYSEKGQAREG